MMNIVDMMSLIENEREPYLYSFNHDRTVEVFIKKGGQWTLRTIDQMKSKEFDSKDIYDVFNEFGEDVEWFNVALLDTIHTIIGYHETKKRYYLDKLGENKYNEITASWEEFAKAIAATVSSLVKDNNTKLRLIK